MKVPFIDLKAQYSALRSELDAAILKVINDSAFAGGPYVEKFEEEFSAYCHCSFAAGVSSGTSALHLALLALGVGPGDEVITSTNTFIATAEAISHCGAVPVFADCNPETYTLDPIAAEKAISPRTRAIIPVHLYGHPADMDAIRYVAKKHDLFVIEDASQAHGAEYNGRRIGSLGDIGCFSFYPGKNLGAYGDAGAVVSNHKHLIHRIKMLRDHGSIRKYEHSMVGWNCRMDGLQGAILSVKLRHLEQATATRRAHAGFYRNLLADCREIKLPREAHGARHVYHIFSVHCNKRDELLTYLTDQGIGCGVHYPKPVHLQDAYSFLKNPVGAFPVAEGCATRQISLPMYPELNADQIEYVAKKVKHGICHVMAKK